MGIHFEEANSIFFGMFEQVIADTAATDAVPLPACSDSSWGPGVAVDQLGLVATPADGIVTTSDGRVHLEFAKTKPANVLCKLRKNGVKDEDLDKYITEHDEGDVVKVSHYSSLRRQL